jgi:MFS family permease
MDSKVNFRLSEVDTDKVDKKIVNPPPPPPAPKQEASNKLLIVLLTSVTVS